jgi:hypothetical protein
MSTEEVEVAALTLAPQERARLTALLGALLAAVRSQAARRATPA